MEEILNNIYLEKPNFSVIPGGFEDFSNFEFSEKCVEFRDVFDEMCVIDKFLSFKSISVLKKFILNFPKSEDVSVSGMIKKYPYIEDSILNLKGSSRNTVFSRGLSSEFTKIINPIFTDRILETDDYFPSDIWQNLIDNSYKWEFVCVSPLFRFMTYRFGGQHVPHYDASYIYNFDNSVRSLYSFVLYLTDNKSGSTRFIKDNQEDIKTLERDHSDWNRLAQLDEVLYEEFPKIGKMLIFPHRMCHDVAEFLPENKDEVRQIIRGDLIFKQI